MQTRVIKMIGKKHFVLTLVETENHEYIIEQETEGGVTTTFPMQDLMIATMVFETMLQKLEGM